MLLRLHVAVVVLNNIVVIRNMLLAMLSVVLSAVDICRRVFAEFRRVVANSTVHVLG